MPSQRRLLKAYGLRQSVAITLVGISVLLVLGHMSTRKAESAPGSLISAVHPTLTSTIPQAGQAAAGVVDVEDGRLATQLARASPYVRRASRGARVTVAGTIPWVGMESTTQFRE